MHIIQESIATFPIPGAYKRVTERHPNIRLYGVTVIPREEQSKMCNMSNSISEQYKFRRYWYCCAGIYAHMYIYIYIYIHILCICLLNIMYYVHI